MKIRSFPIFAAVILESAILVGAAIGVVLPRAAIPASPVPSSPDTNAAVSPPAAPQWERMPEPDVEFQPRTIRT